MKRRGVLICDAMIETDATTTKNRKPPAPPVIIEKRPGHTTVTMFTPKLFAYSLILNTA